MLFPFFMIRLQPSAFLFMRRGQQYQGHLLSHYLPPPSSIYLLYTQHYKEKKKKESSLSVVAVVCLLLLLLLNRVITYIRRMRWVFFVASFAVLHDPTVVLEIIGKCKWWTICSVCTELVSSSSSSSSSGSLFASEDRLLMKMNEQWGGSDWDCFALLLLLLPMSSSAFSIESAVKSGKGKKNKIKVGSKWKAHRPPPIGSYRIATCERS